MLQQDYSYSTCPVASGLLQRRAGRSSSFHTGTVAASPTRSGTHRYGSQAAWPCDSSSSRVALIASRCEDPVQALLAGSEVAWDTHRNISQTFWHRLPIFQVDLHCVLHRVATWSCRGYVDELATEPFLLLHREHGTGYRRSWNCCDRRTCFIVIWKHFCFCLRAPRYGLTLWCALGLLVGAQYEWVFYSYSYHYWVKSFFCEPELTRYMSSSVRLSCDLLRRLKFSAIFLSRLVRRPSVDIQVKCYGDRPRGTTPSGELNTRGVAEYSDFGPIECYILETVQDRSFYYW